MMQSYLKFAVIAAIGAATALPATGVAQVYTKTEEIVYHDNTAKWVLGQVAKKKVDGVEVYAATFDPSTALPLTHSSHGKLEQTISYRTDGTVATVKDGANQVTTLSNWYRGVPRNILYHDGSTRSAVVNDSGWIMSVTDENQFVTGYTYDAMGRMESVSYPTGDSVAWVPTTQVFEPVAAIEYGIAAGHWRQTVSTGNGKKVTYFDGLWRPLLVREYDAANVAETQRFSRFIYDHEGRVTFASYPSASSAPTTGTWTEYDALGRVTSVSQNSELAPPNDILTTTTEYLPGFKTRVTNPRKESVTTAYMAFDEPTTQWPVLIEDSAGRQTQIERDVFGKPRALVRSGSGQ